MHGLVGRHISKYSIMPLLRSLGGGTSHGLREGSPEKVTLSKVLEEKCWGWGGGEQEWEQRKGKSITCTGRR